MGYHCDVPLRWSDMDAYGHVNNVQFLRLLEDARIVAIRDWFGPGDRLLADGILVARHEIEYHAPLVFRHEPVRIDVVVSRVDPAGFTLGYVLRDPEETGIRRYAVAVTQLVTYDFGTGSLTRLDPGVGRALQDRARVDAASGRTDAVHFRWRR
jgi:acyl-CoA thioester hydrolase